MKKTTFYVLSAFMALFTTLPTNAQKLIHLTFQRSGTTASSVTVTAVDEDGNNVNGLTASLESVTTGLGESAEPKIAALFNLKSMASYTQFLGVNMTQDNNKETGWVQFKFKLSGLNNFKFNHVDAGVAAINASGLFQTSHAGDVLYKMQGWNTNTETLPTDIAFASGNFIVTKGKNGTDGVGKVSTVETQSSDALSSESDQFLVLRFTKTDNQGCYFSLYSLDLYNGYRVESASTTNLGNVATFSASKNVTFDKGTTAFIATTRGDNDVTLSPLSGTVLAANGGVIVQSENAAFHAFVTESEATDTRANLLEGSGDATKALTAGSYYIFNKNTDGNAIFSLLGSDKLTLAANKAALKANATDVEGGYSQALNIIFDNPTTSISTNVVSNASANAKVYDLQGRSVKNDALRPGIYVKNGKKIIVK